MSAVPSERQTMPNTRKAEETRITAHDIFDGIFCLLILRGYESINPDMHTAEHYYAYDAACEAVAKKVLELCNEEDSGKYCTFRIVCHNMHGNSTKAREQILSWLSWGGAHIRSNGRGYIFFDMDADWAEETLQRQIAATGFGREVYEELTKTFLSIYRP
jgi:hypothetical protein